MPCRLSAQTAPLRDDSPELIYSDFYDRAVQLQPLEPGDSISPYLSHLWMASLVDSRRPSVLYDLAFFYGSIGETDRTEAYLLRAYEVSGGDHLIGEPLARLALSERDFATAERVIREMLERDPNEKYLLAMLQQAYQMDKQWDKAIDVGKRLLEQTQSDPHQVTTLAWLYTQAGQGNKALELLTDYTTAHPEEQTTLSYLFYLYLTAEQYPEAEQVLQQIHRHQDDLRTLSALDLSLLVAQEQYEETADYILRVAQTEGVTPDLIETMIQSVYSEAKSATAARQALVPVRKQLTKIFPDTPQLRLGLAQDYMLLGDSIAVEREMNSMVDDRVPLASPYVYFTDRYAVAEDTTSLRRYAEAGHEALPEEGVFRLYLALLAVNGGDTIGYRRQLEEAMAEVPEEDSFYPQLALLRADDLTDTGHFDQARPYYDIAVTKPIAPAYNNYAYFLAEKSGTPEDLDRAEELARRAIKLEPDNDIYLDTYAWILHLKGSSSLALIYIRKAIESAASPDVDLYEHLAHILMDVEEYDAAEEAWDRYLELGGDKETRAKAMTEIEEKRATLTEDQPQNHE